MWEGIAKDTRCDPYGQYFVKDGKTINCYVVEVTSQSEMDAVYNYLNMSERVFKHSKWVIGCFIHMQVHNIRNVSTDRSSLERSQTFKDTHMKIHTFDEFLQLSDQSDFDVFNFIKGLG